MTTMTAPRPRPDLHAKLPATSPTLIDHLAYLADEYGPTGVAQTLDHLYPNTNRTPPKPRHTIPTSIGTTIAYLILTAITIAVIGCIITLLRWITT